MKGKKANGDRVEVRHALGLGAGFQMPGEEGQVIPGDDRRRFQGMLAGEPATAWLEEERRLDMEREG